jgi:hypothetical protein
VHSRSGESLTGVPRGRGAPLESKDGTVQQPLTHSPRKKLQKDRGGPTLEKQCRKCGVAKAVSEFPRNPRVSDGFSSWCRACHAQACRESRARQREAARERQWKRQQEHNRRLMEQVWGRPA